MRKMFEASFPFRLVCLAMTIIQFYIKSCF